MDHAVHRQAHSLAAGRVYQGLAGGLERSAAGQSQVRPLADGARSFRADDPSKPVLDELFWALRKDNLLAARLIICVPELMDRTVASVCRVIERLDDAIAAEKRLILTNHYSCEPLRLRQYEHLRAKEVTLLARLEAEHAG